MMKIDNSPKKTKKGDDHIPYLATTDPLPQTLSH